METEFPKEIFVYVIDQLEDGALVFAVEKDIDNLPEGDAAKYILKAQGTITERVIRKFKEEKIESKNKK